MYRVTEGSTAGLPDVEAFLETLRGLDDCGVPEARGLFTADAPLIASRAPGRLDLMGGIADYSGSLVLQLPIREAALAALQRTTDGELRIVSLGAEADARSVSFSMPMQDFAPAGEPMDYEAARTYFRRNERENWAAYAAGAFLVLMRERRVRFAGGARLLIESHVPEGKGVSSSAALEVAVMQAVAAAFEVALEPRELALLCQKVENLVVGAPCGVMDQMTAACGEAGRLLALLCQPAEVQGSLALPQEVSVWGLDSGVRHSVGGADYGCVRTGAFMGYRILEVALGTGDEAPRCLANLSPSELEQSLARHLPERISGEEFLARYGGTGDTVTRVDPSRTYAIRAPTAHPVYDHFRVRTFAELLSGEPGERRLELLGELMYQSHASYSACGLGSEATDRLVTLVREAGPKRGLHGAKITGGGSGGTVAVLGRRGAEDAIREVADRFAHDTGYRPYLFSGSSPGAAAFGVLRLRPTG